MKLGRNGVVIGLAVAALAAYSCHAPNHLVAERVAVVRGLNTMPPDEVTGRFVRPVHNFGDIVRNTDWAISQQYLLKRNFYTSERLAQTLAIAPEHTVVTQDVRDLGIISRLNQGILALPVSAGTVQFQAHYHESLTGKAEGSVGFLLPGGNPIHFADIVGWLGYGFTGSYQNGWVHDSPAPASGLFGNGEIMYDISGRGPYDATILATFNPDGSLMTLSFHETLK